MSLLDTFYWPWALLAGPPLCALIWWDWLRASRRATLRYSDTDALAQAAGNGSWALRARVMMPIFRCLAVLLIAMAIARPRRADEVEKVTTEGVALELVLDRSSSMVDGKDMRNSKTGTMQTRLASVKQVVRGFVEGDGDELKGRKGDLIGLTVFAAYPDTVCPLTRDHDHLLRALDDVTVPINNQAEDGTAIGDALLLGVERIRNIGRRIGENEAFNIKSRALILLTDGLQNRGDHMPVEAAQAAKALDIKIYTIGAAPKFQLVRGLLGTRRVRVPFDESAMREVAEITGGQFFRATDADALRNVYKVIDELERTKIDEESYYLFEELAYRWVTIKGVELPPVLLVAIVLLGLDALLATTRFRHAI